MAPSATNSNSNSYAVTNGQTAPQTPEQRAAAEKSMFMQLLVAQLKNQDPLSPSDGTQFIAQLAQFEQLEQSANSGQDITAIRQDLDQLVGKNTGGASAPQS
jgi:flagellar basal-body rod modification protein FlgD